MIACAILCLVGGYYVFLNGQWDTPSFIFSYFSVALFPALFFGWKFLKRTHWKKPHEVDLKGEVEEIDEYTRNFRPEPSSNFMDKWFNIVFGGALFAASGHSTLLTAAQVSITTRTSSRCRPAAL